MYILRHCVETSLIIIQHLPFVVKCPEGAVRSLVLVTGNVRDDLLFFGCLFPPSINKMNTLSKKKLQYKLCKN